MNEKVIKPSAAIWSQHKQCVVDVSNRLEAVKALDAKYEDKHRNL